MRLSETFWISPSQLLLLEKHQITTLAQLASIELADSMADTIPIDGLRQLARRARVTLGHPDPLAQIGAAAGQSGPVRYAGGVRYNDGKG